ncbi:MAG: 2-oxo-4-hydroxy-4-carboxy-5-ureidoimidazoline decarboxylase [Planctomycetota bacterium]
MDLQTINALPEDRACQAMLGCCGSNHWATQMARARPFGSAAALHDAAERVFDGLAEADWLEAFGAHPKLGDVDSLRMKFAGNRAWSAGEQAGVAQAGEQTLAELAEANRRYEKSNGFIFILCASGLSAQAMLDALRARLQNDRATEIDNAGQQQRKITHLRLDKLLTAGSDEIP